MRSIGGGVISQTSGSSYSPPIPQSDVSGLSTSLASKAAAADLLSTNSTLATTTSTANAASAQATRLLDGTDAAENAINAINAQNAETANFANADIDGNVFGTSYLMLQGGMMIGDIDSNGHQLIGIDTLQGVSSSSILVISTLDLNGGHDIVNVSIVGAAEVQTGIVEISTSINDTANNIIFRFPGDGTVDLYDFGVMNQITSLRYGTGDSCRLDFNIATLTLTTDSTSVSLNIAKGDLSLSGAFIGGRIITANTTATATFNTAGKAETINNTSASTIASLTIALPSASSKGQILRYSSKGTATIVTVTGTIGSGAALTTLAANSSVTWEATDTIGTFNRIA